jgi:glutathione peroxidase-family protein
MRQCHKFFVNENGAIVKQFAKRYSTKDKEAAV